MAHASVANSKPKVELDLYADTCKVGKNCLVNNNHNDDNYDLRDGHRSVKTIDAILGY